MCAARMAGLFRLIGVPTSVRMEIKPQWELGASIRVIDARLRQGRWIVKATASGEARCPGRAVESGPQDDTVPMCEGYRIYPSRARSSSFR